MKIRVGDITADDALQARAVISEATIGEYAEAMAAGAIFPPITVFHDGAVYWLADGFHRMAAARRTGLDTIEADVREGSARDAKLYATGANVTHGLRRTNADKRRAVTALLEDAEWSAWSDREIARQCGVTHPFVAKVRAELSGNGYHSSNDYPRNESIKIEVYPNDRERTARAAAQALADRFGDDFLEVYAQEARAHNGKVVAAVAMKEAGYGDDEILDSLAITDPYFRDQFATVLANFGPNPAS